MPKYTLTRAAKFLKRRGWAKVSVSGKLHQVEPTPEGQRALQQLNRELKKELFARLKLTSDPENAKILA
ncbi:MAG: hypothetical protein ACRD3Q_05160, partial [Terriglobales bacterium]